MAMALAEHIDFAALGSLLEEEGLRPPSGDGCFPCECRMLLEDLKRYTQAVLSVRRTLKRLIDEDHDRCKQCTILVGDGHTLNRMIQGYCEYCALDRGLYEPPRIPVFQNGTSGL